MSRSKTILACLAVVFVMLIQASALFAQKPVLSHQDKIKQLNKTGSGRSPMEKVAVHVENGLAGQELSFQGLRMNDKRIFVFTIKTGSVDVVTISPGSLAYLILAGDTIRLVNSNTTVSRFDRSSNSAQLTVNYLISNDNEIALLDNKLKSIRLEYNNGIFTFDLNDKQAERFQHICTLIK